jgi:hypothetical protein
MPGVRERLIGMATGPIGNTSEQFGVFMKAETAKWPRVITGAGIIAEQ